MRQSLLIIFLVFLTSHTLYSQVDIKIRIKQTHLREAKLYHYQNSTMRLIDSSLQKSPELFEFKLRADYVQGLYKLALGSNIGFNFVVASEPQISLETVIFAAEDSLKSIVSKENELFIQFQKIKKRYAQRLWHLNSLIDFYPDSSLFLNQLNNEIFKLSSNFNTIAVELARGNSSLFASNLILLEIKPIPNAGLLKSAQRNLLKEDWWTNANLTDGRLTGSPELKSKLWQFIDLFFNDGYTKEKQDSSFIAAVKILMNQNADTSIRNGFRRILFENYLETDYDATTRFLYNNSFEGLPTMQLSPEERALFDLLGKNGIGSKAFDFRVTSSNGNSIKLSKIDAPYKLAIFWSIDCPHCTEMLPELANIYQKFKDRGFEIIAISIDEDEDSWRNIITTKKLGWINAREPDSGKSKILKEYGVDGTPMLFLIDKNLSIISRPSKAKQLEAKLNEIFR